MTSPTGISRAPRLGPLRGDSHRSGNERLRVAFIITRADAVGGATVHVRDVARGLADRGHEAIVLVGGRGEVLTEFDRAGVPYISLRWLDRSIQPFYDLRALFELKAALEQIRPNLVCAHTAKAGLLGRAAAALTGIPAIYTPHGWTIGDRISESSARFFRLCEKVAGKFSSSIINVCMAERELARRHKIASDEQLAVIYNGVHDVDAEARANPLEHPPRLVMVARFEPPKDHATLLEAASMLRDLPWTLELVGAGPGRNKAMALAEALHIAERVMFTGGSTLVSDRLGTAQIFVLSSRSEAFPLSILEAMRAALPVVASNVGGISEAVLDGETGFLVGSRDAESLAQALRPLIANPLLRQKLGQAGRRRYETQFTFEKMMAETLSLYRDIVASSHGRSAKNQQTRAKEATVGR